MNFYLSGVLLLSFIGLSKGPKYYPVLSVSLLARALLLCLLKPVHTAALDTCTRTQNNIHETENEKLEM